MDNENLIRAYGKYFDTVYRICFVLFHGNKADTEDAVHTVFMKYMEYTKGFENDEHEKAWLIVTAKNTCKSVLRLARRKNAPLDAAADRSEEFRYNDTLDAIMRLPEKEKTAVYLCYYEDMTAAQAAEIMGCRENTVYSYLHRARKKLERSLGE